MKRLGVNVATIPFTNRAVPAAILSVVLGVAVLFTVFNGASFAVLGGEYRSQRKELKDQDERLAALSKDIAEKGIVLQSGAVASYADEAQYVAKLLDEKRFSWLRFLDDLENIKAYGCLFQTISPQISSDGVIHLSLRGMANPRAEMLKLEQNLFANPRFRKIQLSTEQKEPSNPMVNFNLTCIYVPETNDAP